MTLTVTCRAQPGLQDHLDHELQQRFNNDTTTVSNVPGVTVEATPTEALRITYLSQLVQRTTLHVAAGPADTLDQITLPDHDALTRLDNTSYRVSCERTGDHSYTSVDVEQHIGGQLTSHGYDNIDLTAPENTVHVRVHHDHYHIGLDLSGRDLSQRQYKVFSSGQGINATLGSAFIQEANIPAGKRVVNPFSHDGLIPIETALKHNGVSVNHYDRDFRFDELDIIDFFDLEDQLDKIDDELADDGTEIHCYDRDFRNLKAQKKNAKIAGVDDHIEFSRFEPEYLDLKFNDFDVDLIYGRPEQPSRHIPEEKIRRVYHDLFRYVKYVLTEDGKMVFLLRSQRTNPLIDIANEFTLSVDDTTHITYHDLDYTILTLRRQHPDALEATHL